MVEEDLRYPIGKFLLPEKISSSERLHYISIIENLPLKIRNASKGLSDVQLNTSYRDGGWTLRQVIHHVADSHMNAYIRFKLALTEDNPTIKPYVEERWAELPEAKTADPEVSLKIIEAIHIRWVMMLQNIKEEQWSRTFFHPEKQKQSRIDTMLALYAWHSEHHLGHITSTRKRMNW